MSKFDPPAKETKSDKQWRFLRMLVVLISHAEGLGYKLTQGDAYRDPRVHGEVGVKMGYGHAKSGHKNRLAQDFNLFINNVFQQDTNAFEPLGVFWESLSSDARWGGRFSDGNHFSLEHEGVK